jgi:hypothetical protein
MMRTTDDVLDRLRAEYLEMPGLQLTREQVERLCGIERVLCQLVLDRLVNERFLCVKSSGHYARPPDGEIARPRTAKVDLRPEGRAQMAS